VALIVAADGKVETQTLAEIAAVLNSSPLAPPDLVFESFAEGGAFAEYADYIASNAAPAPLNSETPLEGGPAGAPLSGEPSTAPATAPNSQPTAAPVSAPTAAPAAAPTADPPEEALPPVTPSVPVRPPAPAAQGAWSVLTTIDSSAGEVGDMTVGGNDIFMVQGNSVNYFSGGRWVPLDTSGISELRGSRRRGLRQSSASIASIAVESNDDVWIVLSSGSVWVYDMNGSGKWTRVLNQGTASQAVVGGDGNVYLVGFGGSNVIKHQSAGGNSET
jgi:hypothetical protein